LNLRVYVSFDEKAFYVSIYNKINRIYITITLRRLPGNRTAFYGVSVIEVNDSSAVIGTKVFLSKETEKSRNLPRTLRKNEIPDDVWNTLREYFLGSDVSAPYTLADLQWWGHTVGEDQVRRQSLIKLGVLVD
jgi:hypothetical protein